MRNNYFSEILGGTEKRSLFFCKVALYKTNYFPGKEQQFSLAVGYEFYRSSLNKSPLLSLFFHISLVDKEQQTTS
jgi:hypothetical protein